MRQHGDLADETYNNAIRSAAGTWQISQIRIQAADQIKTTAGWHD